jgi:hypothetical protein
LPSGAIRTFKEPEMRRSAIWGALALVIAVLSMSLPVQAQGGKGARAVFEANLVPGLYWTPATEGGFVKGGVRVLADGTVEVKITGAQPNETYDVLMGYLLYFHPAVPGSTPIMGDVTWPAMASGVEGETLKLTTDAKGNGTASHFLPNLEYPCIGFALDDVDNDEGAAGPNRYVTGVRFYQ